MASPFVVPGLKTALLDHQVRGLEWMIARERSSANGVRGGIVCDEMGMGKTLQIITLMLKHRRPEPTIVVCPKSVIGEWLEQAQRFAPLSLLGVALGPGECIPSSFNFLVVSYDTVKSRLEELMQRRWSRVVLDEAHRIKNTPPTASANIACNRLAATIPFRWALTATPITRVMNDAVRLLEFIGVPLASRKRKRGSEVDGDLEALRDTYVLRRTVEDGNEVLPPLVVHTHALAFQYAEELEAYKEAYDAYEGTPLQFVHLRGQVSWDPSLGVSTKMDALEQRLLGQPSSAQAVVFYAFNAEADEICRRATRAVGKTAKLHGDMTDAGRRDVIDRFKAGEYRVLAVQVRVGCEGLNLQNAQYVYTMTLPWNATEEQQAISRVWRSGQRNRVTYIRFVMRNTIDEFVLNLYAKKHGQAARLLPDLEAKIHYQYGTLDHPGEYKRVSWRHRYFNGTPGPLVLWNELFTDEEHAEFGEDLSSSLPLETAYDLLDLEPDDVDVGDERAAFEKVRRSLECVGKTEESYAAVKEIEALFCND